MNSKFKKLLAFTPGLLVFRIVQSLNWHFLRITKAWPRLDIKVSSHWTDDTMKNFVDAHSSSTVIIEPSALGIIRDLSSQDPAFKKTIMEFANSVVNCTYQVFGTELPKKSPLPWKTDWRYDFTWNDKFYRDYNFYTPKPQEYDIKYPWELSRLGIILPLLQNACISDERYWLKKTHSYIRDWSFHNPLANTANWVSMEVSMRSINLVTALDMVNLIGFQKNPNLTKDLLKSISMHGEFIWRNLEKTPVSGNHYAANIVSLILISISVGKSYPKSAKWMKFSIKELSRIIKEQILEDGVHIEKSTSYQRLVSELFMLAIIAIKKASLPIPNDSIKRLHKSCNYLKLSTRPDGKLPNIGDNDGAKVFQFETNIDSTDMSVLGSIAASILEDPSLKLPDTTFNLSEIWILGKKYNNREINQTDTEKYANTSHFTNGGVIVAKDHQNFLWIDVGEIGLKGRGGHGHNDTLSFELSLKSTPLIIDPGCPTYTGNPQMRNQFRSSCYHNTITVDDQEIAPMSGMWSISNEAEPFDVSFESLQNRCMLSASHGGYKRLTDPVVINRSIVLDFDNGEFQCSDTIECSDSHQVNRYIHFAEATSIQTEENQYLLTSGGNEWILEFDCTSESRQITGLNSPSYGILRSAPIIVLTNSVKASKQLFFKIRNS